jgi:hypothetical protein
MANLTIDEYLNMLEALIFYGFNIEDQNECIEALFQFTNILDASQDDE